jgi:hypothetical protein
VLTADPVADELLGNVCGQPFAVLVHDQVQEQIQRGGAARARAAVAIDLEQLRGNDDIGEFFAQTGHVFPVNGAPVTIQQISDTCPCTTRR